MARSSIVGIPKGLSSPLILGIQTLLRGEALYCDHLIDFNLSTAFSFCSSNFHITLSIPRVFPVRFADDIQVSADGPEQLEKVKEIITKFLKPRGLVLNEGKTIMKPIELGFEFLGFQIREYPDKTKLLKSKPKKKRGFNSKTN
jgi:hypothetical protein